MYVYVWKLVFVKLPWMLENINGKRVIHSDERQKFFFWLNVSAKLEKLQKYSLSLFECKCWKLSFQWHLVSEWVTLRYKKTVKAFEAFLVQNGSFINFQSFISFKLKLFLYVHDDHLITVPLSLIKKVKSIVYRMSK